MTMPAREHTLRGGRRPGDRGPRAAMRAATPVAANAAQAPLRAARPSQSCRINSAPRPRAARCAAALRPRAERGLPHGGVADGCEPVPRRSRRAAPASTIAARANCRPTGPRPTRCAVGGGCASAGRERPAARQRRSPRTPAWRRCRPSGRTSLAVSARRPALRGGRRLCERGPRASIGATAPECVVRAAIRRAVRFESVRLPSASITRPRLKVR